MKLKILIMLLLSFFVFVSGSSALEFKEANPSVNLTVFAFPLDSGYMNTFIPAEISKVRVLSSQAFDDVDLFLVDMDILSYESIFRYIELAIYKKYRNPNCYLYDNNEVLMNLLSCDLEI